MIVALYIYFQRKELEDFKERMRARKEQRLLKNASLISENWRLHFAEKDFSAGVPTTSDKGSDFWGPRKPVGLEDGHVMLEISAKISYTQRCDRQ